MAPGAQHGFLLVRADNSNSIKRLLARAFAVISRASYIFHSLME